MKKLSKQDLRKKAEEILLQYMPELLGCEDNVLKLLDNQNCSEDARKILLQYRQEQRSKLCAKAEMLKGCIDAYSTAKEMLEA